MNQYNPKEYWDEAAKDPDVRYKYIADKWAATKNFLQIIEFYNKKWGKVLEIGCGIGRLLVPLADKHKKCIFYGLDISDEMIKKAPKRKNIFYNEIDKGLDLVYSMLVFQHIPHDEKISYIKQAYELLKPEGILLVQFVKGKENEPYSYQTSNDEMIKAFSEVGFRHIKCNEMTLHNSWSIIIGEK